MQAVFFAHQDEFREWLYENHAKENALVVGFYKVHTKKPSMTWSESVDQALCFGWIDGVRSSLDADSYQIRFTPRKKSSIWSAVNIKKVEHLTALGLMQPAGLEIYGHRRESHSKIYAFENDPINFSPEFEHQFKENENAWNYFQNLAPTYRKTSSFWVMIAKQESTRIKRLEMLISDCEAETNRWKDNKYKK